MYCYASSLLPSGVQPSLCSTSSDLVLDSLPGDCSLSQAGLVDYATLMVVPANSSTSFTFLPMKLIIAGLIVILAASAIKFLDLSDAHNNFSHRSLAILELFLGYLNHFINELGGMYYVFGTILFLCVFLLRPAKLQRNSTIFQHDLKQVSKTEVILYGIQRRH